MEKSLMTTFSRSVGIVPSLVQVKQLKSRTIMDEHYKELGFLKKQS